MGGSGWRKDSEQFGDDSGKLQLVLGDLSCGVLTAESMRQEQHDGDFTGDSSLVDLVV